MPGKSPPSILLVMVLFGLLFTPAATLPTKDYTAEHYDVKLVARHDGSIMVTETVVFRFSGGPFTYVFREIPTDDTDGVTGFAASMDGVPFPTGMEAGQLEVRGKDPLRITWHFSPVSDSTHTFILNYRALGVTRVDEKYDLLIWNAIPFEHDYLILSSTVQIAYPQKSRVAQNPVVNLEKARVKSSGSTFLILTKNLKENDGLQVALRFDRNSLISEMPGWQKHRVETNKSINRVLPWSLATFALLILAGIGGMYLFWEQNAGLDRNEETSAEPSLPRSTPPGDPPPAFPGVLIATGARPAWPHALAALLDLARRGIVTIQEAGETRWHGQRDFCIQLNAQPAELKPHEVGLLDFLFTTKQGSRTRITVSELGDIVSDNFKKFSSPLYEEMQAAGLLGARRLALRDRLMRVGLIILVAGLVISIVSLVASALSIDHENWTVMTMAAVAISIGSSCTLIGPMAMIVSAIFSPLTERGIQEARNWKVYAEYLREVTREREPVTQPGLFESTLAYATSFGIGEAWSKFFQKHGDTGLPPWFQALSYNVDINHEAGMAAFVAMMSASCAAGSHSASTAGGAGASGGGSSGAG